MNDEALRTVLVVDDAPANIQVLAGILKGRYRVRVATSGEKALAVVQKARPDLVLLDVIMPGIDGYQVCERLRADPATVDIPVVFVSGNVTADDRSRGEQAGGVAYLGKPVDADEILTTIAGILGS